MISKIQAKISQTGKLEINLKLVINQQDKTKKNLSSLLNLP